MPASKLPWYYESDGDGPSNRRRDQYIVGHNGLERIVTVDSGNHLDAKLIVRAVNNHQKLIDALNATMVLAETAMKRTNRGMSSEYDIPAALDSARAILAKIKGE